MTGATHMLAAAVIYRHGKFKTPALMGLAFFSHFLLDAAPHHELSLTWNYVLALPAAALLACTAWRDGDWRVLAAAFLGVLPDINWIFGLNPTLVKVHTFFHFRKTFFPVPAFFLFVELCAAAFCLFILIRPDRRRPPGQGAR